MTQHILSSPAPRSKGESKSVKVSRSPEGRGNRPTKKRRDARPKKTLELTSNATLLARSKEFMKNLLEEFDMRPPNGDDLFGAVRNAKLGKKFYHKKRSDQRKALAAGCALYHVISCENDSVAALRRLAKSMNVDLPRTSDPCRIIVECLTDYGATPDERTLNRQFAARDARALRYVIRLKMEPQQIKKPEKGESITKWANREAEYRKPRKAVRARPDTAEAGRSTTSESAKRELPVIRPLEQRYCFLEKWTRKGLFLVDSKHWGCALAVIASPLGRLTADQAKSRPDKVRAVLQKALDKGIEKTAEMSPSASVNDEW